MCMTYIIQHAEDPLSLEQLGDGSMDGGKALLRNSPLALVAAVRGNRLSMLRDVCEDTAELALGCLNRALERVKQST